MLDQAQVAQLPQRSLLILRQTRRQPAIAAILLKYSEPVAVELEFQRPKYPIDRVDQRQPRGLLPR